jgi:hypothetical protein
VYDTILLGQVNLLITMFLCLAVWLSAMPQSRPRDDILAGLFVGLAATIKVYPIIIMVLFVLCRRWRIVVASGATIVATSLIGVWFGNGIANSIRWVSVVFPSISSSRQFPVNQSLQSVAERLFSPYDFSVPVLSTSNFVQVATKPLIDAPSAAVALTLVGTVVILLLVIARICTHARSGRNHGEFVYDFCLLVTTMLIITPVVWDHYYVILLMPIAVLGRNAARNPPQHRLALLLGLFFIMLHRYWRWLTLYFQSPFLMLFGLAGVITLWLALLRPSDLWRSLSGKD